MKLLKKLKILLPALLLLLSLALFAACGGNNDGDNGNKDDGNNQNQTEKPDGEDKTPAGTGGTVTIASRISIDIDDEPLVIPYELTGGDGPVEWKSESPSVAIVLDGKLRPIMAGTTKITAKTSTSSTAFEVVVTDEYRSYTKISTVEDFENIVANKRYTSSSRKFCLENDIDFGGKTIQPLGGWNDTKNAFKATFDGRGFALKNFKIVNPESCKDDEYYFGVSLFPYIVGGTVRNLSIVNATLTGTGFTGGIAGQLESGLIENCYINGTVTATEGFAMSVPAGGICGIMGAKAQVKDVFLDADVLGGFVFAGFNFGTGSNCAVRESAITALKNGEELLFCTDDTGNGNEEENKQLKEFDKKTCLILKDNGLTSLKNYPFSESSNWAIMSGYKAFIARADGKAPDWAKS